jgi:hypothetical protein
VFAGLDAELAQMTVTCRQAEPVTQHDEIAVVAAVGRRLDDPVGGGENGMAFFGRDIEALMEPGFAGERIASTAVGARQPPPGPRASRRLSERRSGDSRGRQVDHGARRRCPREARAMSTARWRARRSPATCRRRRAI